MDNTTTENKKSFLQNDRRLVCSMLVFYGVCIVGVIALTFWGLARRNQTISTNATSTAAVVATQRASTTSTAIARVAKQNSYEYIERFDKVSGRWFVGQYDRRYADAHISIKDGFYMWDVADPKSFTQATDFYKGNKLKDFDIYMDLKFIESSKAGAACSGFFFRRPYAGWEFGAYTFIICDNSHFKVLHYDRNGWQTITYSEYETAIHNSDWNRIETSARVDHFTFTINNKQVFEMTDDRLKLGSLGIFVMIEKENSAVIWFDNFGYQSR
jgi:hypothetical protein